MKIKISCLIILGIVILGYSNNLLARMMPGDYHPEQISKRVSEYVIFAVQKNFQPIKYNSDQQSVIVTGVIEINYKLFKTASDNETFARDEKKLLYQAFEKNGWKKVNARHHLGEVFGEIEITYEKRNREPRAKAEIKIGNFSSTENRNGSEDRAKWFSEEIAKVVNLRLKEQFQFQEVK